MSIDDDPTENISHEQKQNKQYTHTHTRRCGLNVEFSTFFVKINQTHFFWLKMKFPFNGRIFLFQHN
jgi:hypothetical protein